MYLTTLALRLSPLRLSSVIMCSRQTLEQRDNFNEPTAAATQYYRFQQHI